MIDKTKNPKPYTYVVENDFEKMEEMARLAAEKAKEPTYTEKEYLQTKEKAYQEGLEEGQRRALNNQENHIANALDRMIERLDTLISRQIAYEALQQKETVHLAFSMIKKIMPQFIEKNGRDEIERILNNVLKNHIKVNELVVYTHSEMMRPVSMRMEEILKEHDFDTRLTFKTDDSLELSDCRAEWGEGGIARIVPSLWSEIENQIEAYLDGDKPHNYETQMAQADDLATKNNQTSELTQVEGELKDE